MSARRLLIAPALIAALVAGGCSGDEPGPPPPPSSDGTTGTPTGPQGPVDFVPGEYEFDFAGVKAALSFDGNTASLTITNRTGAELGPPTISAYARDGAKSSAEVEGAAPIPDGDQVDLTVVFAPGITEDTVGAVELGFGRDVWSWMAPKPASG